MERRLAAILVADVVGYSRLMQADEAGTMAALKSRRAEVLQPLVTKHRGRVVKLMGDGVLVEFASAVNAVQCAVELQQAMDAANAMVPEDRRIVLRIGVNLGDVMVEGQDLYGDGVNVAARLQATADPGTVVVSQTVHSHVQGKVELRFEDLGERTLKNIAEPVRIYRVSSRSIAGDSTPAKTAPPSKPSLAVLPFVNMSGDPEQEYFSDGITEDIITELSRFRSLLVIARNSSFQFRGKSLDMREVARKLGADYLVEGSVRRLSTRLRITTQLIDGATGNHLWAERYDRELADIFAIQDEVTANIVGTLAVELESDSLERAKQKRPESLEAYEHWLRGKKIGYHWVDNLEARKHFERAAAADPHFSRALSGLASTYSMEALSFPLPSDFRAIHDMGFQYALRALALDEADYRAHTALAWFYLYRGDCDQTRKHIERAIRLNPNDADTLADATYLFAALGEPEEGIKLGRAALRLNPHHPDWYQGFLAMALFTARNYAEAMSVRLQVPEAFIDSSFSGAATLAYLGRLDEAKRWAEKGVSLLKATPGGALAVAQGGVIQVILNNNPNCRQEDRDHFAEGMRKAGVPG